MDTRSYPLDQMASVPAWVPSAARHYIAHTETGTSIREIARQSGVHASTVLRRIRRLEARRDDPLIDSALRHIGEEMNAQTASQLTSPVKDLRAMPKSAVVLSPA